MNNLIGLGKNGNGEQVYVAEKNMNRSYYAAGSTTSGKTNGLMKVGIDNTCRVEKFITINYHKCLDRETLMSDVREKYESMVTVIDVAKEGLGLPLFEAIIDNNGNKESKEAVIKRVTNLFAVACKLAPSYKALLSKAVIDTEKLYDTEGSYVFYNWLMAMDTVAAYTTAEKVAPLCRENLIHNGNFLDTSSKVIELDFNGIEYDEQIFFVNFVLDYFLRTAMKGVYMSSGLAVFIDEVQNLNFGPDSPIDVFLNEGRRLNTQLFIAFQSIKGSGKKGFDVVNQCGTRLYFIPIPSERREIAKLIGHKSEIDSIVYGFSRFKPGDFYACGDLTTDGKTMKKIVAIQGHKEDNKALVEVSKSVQRPEDTIFNGKK